MLAGHPGWHLFQLTFPEQKQPARNMINHWKILKSSQTTGQATSKSDLPNPILACHRQVGTGHMLILNRFCLNRWLGLSQFLHITPQLNSNSVLKHLGKIFRKIQKLLQMFMKQPIKCISVFFSFLNCTNIKWSPYGVLVTNVTFIISLA